MEDYLMTKYIKGKDGKFAGSIGVGKNKVPLIAPEIPQLKDPFDEQMSNMVELGAKVIQWRLDEEIQRTFQEFDGAMDGSIPPFIIASRINRLHKMAETFTEDRQPNQAEAMRSLANGLEYSLELVAAVELVMEESEDDDDDSEITLGIDTQALYSQTSQKYVDAVKKDYLAVDDEGEYVAARSFRAYEDYKGEEDFPGHWKSPSVEVLDSGEEKNV
jgi:hypothetical protein